ncbi:MAG TPA: malectin domain-containing carbohydrate-binding protein [Terracidiphilus sp.]|nr:malectin domain-containing carbohydrate-binding protein [Terracidiphilus sp.]
MATEGPEQVDIDAWRAELDAVLHSECFTRAPTLAHLLSYLCEKLFAGEARQIKEYSVGVEVFHRGASFDQDSDSIVRVEANRLRKRIAEYYAGEGASHRLHISIPVGQYVPQFESAAAREGKKQPALPDSTIASWFRIRNARILRMDEWFRLSGRRIWWLVAALALISLGLGCALLIMRPLKQTPPQAASNQSFALPEESQFGPPTGEEVRILAGAGRSFVDHAGKLWNADAGFDGGSAVKSSVQHIWRTQDPDFYRTSRQGQFHYAIPLKKGIYELRLHFAETDYGPESTGTGGEGSRLMSVRANGKTLLTRFDVAADAGASRTADVKVFTDITPASDGLLHLEFAGEDGKQAILSAIEILPGYRGRIRPVRLLARQTPYYSNDSHWWSPDNYFEGGQLAAYTSPVKGTDDPELYETERWGNFSYAIPVSPGTYSVFLHFAVRHGDWDQPSSSSGEERTPVAHIFDVFCNGNSLLKSFNPAKEARQTDVVIRKFTDLRPNAQGKLLLSFVPVEGYATVTGIEVLPQ